MASFEYAHTVCERPWGVNSPTRVSTSPAAASKRARWRRFSVAKALPATGTYEPGVQTFRRAASSSARLRLGRVTRTRRC